MTEVNEVIAFEKQSSERPTSKTLRSQNESHDTPTIRSRQDTARRQEELPGNYVRAGSDYYARRVAK